MRPRHLLPALIVFVLLTVTVSANEILHMTNGTTMAIKSHEIHGTMIHVDLGSNAKIAFPAGQVEKITKAGKNVYVQPSLRGAKKGRSGSRIEIESKMDSRHQQKGWAPDKSKRKPYSGGDAAGKALEKLMEQQGGGAEIPTGYRPFRDHPNKAVRGMTATGNVSAYRDAMTRNGRRGASTTASGRTIIPPPGAGRGSSRPEVTGIKKEVDPVWAAIRDSRGAQSRAPGRTPATDEKAPGTDQSSAGGE